jgi:hypothetical protein
MKQTRSRLSTVPGLRWFWMEGSALTAAKIYPPGICDSLSRSKTAPSDVLWRFSILWSIAVRIVPAQLRNVIFHRTASNE